MVLGLASIPRPFPPPVSLDGTFLQINSCRITTGISSNNSHPAVDIGVNLHGFGKETIRFNIGTGLQVQIVAFADTLQVNKE